MFISLSACETADDYQHTRLLMIDRQLAFMPCFLGCKESCWSRVAGLPYTARKKTGDIGKSHPLAGYSAESLIRFLRSLCPVFRGAARLREMANTECFFSFGFISLHRVD
jgi:hypothetical protein